VNEGEEQSYPMQATQIVKSAVEKAASKTKAETKKGKEKVEKKKPGRPKGRKNKDKQDMVLNPELLRIQKAMQTLLGTVGRIIA